MRSKDYTDKDIDFMKQACLMCDYSTCGYKTGCIAVKNLKVILTAFNEALPGNPYCQNNTCTREEQNLYGGKDMQKVCSIHAEASIISQAAAQGISLKGVDIYVTTFPCVICARSLVKACVKNVFVMSDYTGGNISQSLFDEANIKVTQITEKEVWGDN